MNDLEFKVAYKNESSWLTFVQFDVIRNGKQIGCLFENYDYEFKRLQNWRLYLYDMPNPIEFNSFYDTYNYISTL